MRRSWLALALLVSTGAFAEDSWYAARISRGDAPLRIDHLWSKGSRLRSETVFLGHPIVTIVRGDRYVIFDRLQRQGVSIERSPRAVAEDATRGRPFGNEFDTLRQAGAEKVRTEEVAGRSCDLYRITNAEGRREICVTGGEEPLPLYWRFWLRATGAQVEANYIEWDRDVKVSDVFFETPPDVQIEFVSYQDYVERAPKERIGPAPPFHRDLLHGSR